MASQSHHLHQSLEAACQDASMHDLPSADHGPFGSSTAHHKVGYEAAAQAKPKGRGSHAGAADSGGGFGSTLGSVSDNLHILASWSADHYLAAAAALAESHAPASHVPRHVASDAQTRSAYPAPALQHQRQHRQEQELQPHLPLQRRFVEEMDQSDKAEDPPESPMSPMVRRYLEEEEVSIGTAVMGGGSGGTDAGAVADPAAPRGAGRSQLPRVRQLFADESPAGDNGGSSTGAEGDADDSDGARPKQLKRGPRYGGLTISTVKTGPSSSKLGEIQSLSPPSGPPTATLTSRPALMSGAGRGSGAAVDGRMARRRSSDGGVDSIRSRGGSSRGSRRSSRKANHSGATQPSMRGTAAGSAYPCSDDESESTDGWSASHADSFASNPVLIAAGGRVFPKGAATKATSSSVLPATSAPAPGTAQAQAQQHAPQRWAAGGTAPKPSSAALAPSVCSLGDLESIAAVMPGMTAHEEDTGSHAGAALPRPFSFSSSSSSSQESGADSGDWHSEPESRVWPSPPVSPEPRPLGQEMSYGDLGMPLDSPLDAAGAAAAMAAAAARAADAGRAYSDDSSSSESDFSSEDSVRSDPLSPARVWPSPPASPLASPHNADGDASGSAGLPTGFDLESGSPAQLREISLMSRPLAGVGHATQSPRDALPSGGSASPGTSSSSDINLNHASGTSSPSPVSVQTEPWLLTCEMYRQVMHCAGGID